MTLVKHEKDGQKCRETEINGLKVRLLFAEKDNHEVEKRVGDMLRNIAALPKAA
ncbi:MAG: hypothetical protein ACI3VN_11625 [Candidatus Onthomonas sp.]